MTAYSRLHGEEELRKGQLFKGNEYSVLGAENACNYTIYFDIWRTLSIQRHPNPSEAKEK